ncbi:LexA family transcriptional regulator [Salinisphaera sp. Q1T1-3]|uniref:LexA family transcriptional regulator n=1 Tax=Salinisphaera sp. Q1T1-3 TaxID=2321229 RepID=UPI001314E328|nr:LexA family transcriptional regulator [Salinisphaera sp. Q1T1-3]
MPDHRRVAERFKALRKAWGRTQKQAGEAIGGGLRTWQNYETGQSAPNWRALHALNAAGVNVNWLLSGYEPMFDDTRQVASEIREPGAGYDTGPVDRDHDSRDFLAIAPLPDAPDDRYGRDTAYCRFDRAFARTIAHRVDDLRTAIQADDTMPGIVEPDRLMLVDTGQRVLVPAQIFAVRLAGRITVRRVDQDPDGRLYLRATGDRYDDIALDDGVIETVEVAGRIVWADRVL